MPAFRNLFLFIFIFIYNNSYAYFTIDYNAKWMQEQPLKNAEKQYWEAREQREEYEKEHGLEPLADPPSPYKKLPPVRKKTETKEPDGLYFKYNPSISKQVRTEVIKKFIELGKKQGQMTAEKERTLNTFISGIDIMETAGAVLKKKGHSPYNLATATGYWLASHLQIVHNTDITDSQLAAVIKQIERQMKDTMANIPGNTEKQKAAEHLMWTATLQLLSYRNVRDKGGSAEALEDVANVSRVMLREEFNLDADKIIIGDKGLMPKN